MPAFSKPTPKDPFMMPQNTTKRLKKVLSGFLIFSIFFLQTVQLPLLVPEAEAAPDTVPNLVSIIVNSETNKSHSSRIKRYAADIQAALENTRVIVVEVPNSVSPHNIAALNEKLYYEGDGKGIARLVGTVLVGSLPIPVVHSRDTTFLSIYPYTDFEDKAFVYDESAGYYESAKTPPKNDVPEVWHGVIMPNTGSKSQDSDRIGTFLDKTHDFYKKQGVFSKSLAEPFMFYLDTLHDQKSSRLQDWKAYNLGLENIEDLSYNRFNKYLAKKLYDAYQSFS